jgi:hypothetical protein
MLTIPKSSKQHACQVKIISNANFSVRKLFDENSFYRDTEIIILFFRR